MTENQEAYLGDGAYAEWLGYTFVVYTSNGIERTNEVYLEPEHMEALIAFACAITDRIP